MRKSLLHWRYRTLRRSFVQLVSAVYASKLVPENSPRAGEAAPFCSVFTSPDHPSGRTESPLVIGTTMMHCCVALAVAWPRSSWRGASRSLPARASPRMQVGMTGGDLEGGRDGAR